MGLSTSVDTCAFHHAITAFLIECQNFALEGSHQQQAFTRANAARQFVFRIDNTDALPVVALKRTRRPFVLATYTCVSNDRQKYRRLAFFRRQPSITCERAE